MGSIFSFLFTGAWVHVFLKRFCFFFNRRGLNFCKGCFFFSKKKELLFPEDWCFFLSKGFFSNWTGFQFFEGMWFFFSFFQMVLFLLFLQNTRTFFFFKMVEIFFKKFVFCKV